MANAFTNFFSRIFTSGLFVNRRRQYHYEQLRERQSYWQSNSIYLDNIYNKIATDVAMLRFKHVQITRKDNAPDTWKWFEQSDIADIISYSPNAEESPVVFWSNVVRAVVQDGVAVVVPTRAGGTLMSAELADSVSGIAQGKVVVQVKERTYELSTGDVWIFENPKKNLTAQLGQITKLIDDNLRAVSVKINEQPNSKVRGFLKIPTTSKDLELRKYAEKRVESVFAGAERGGIGFLEKDEEFQELTKDYRTADPEELEFLKSQLYQAFGINEALFTCDYTESQYRAYFQSVLKVYLRVIAEELNRKLFTTADRKAGHRVHAYYDMADIVSLKDMAEFAFKTKYAALASSNELREMYMSLPPYEGGDTYESNLNAVRVGNESGG